MARETTTGAMPASALYTSPSAAALKYNFVGKRVEDVQAPAAIIDRAVVRRNCRLMLEATQKLNVGFRAHIKTHKTIEVTRLQVGEAPLPVKLIASTVLEIEHLLPWLITCRQDGRHVNVIYGLPVSPSAIPRLAAVARILGEESVSLFVDHPDQIRHIERASSEASWPGQIPVFVNIDVGGGREGVPAASKQLRDIAEELNSSSGRVRLEGLYAYFNPSYNGGSPQDALNSLALELKGLEEGAGKFVELVKSERRASKVTLSIGATPTATAAQNILHGDNEYRKLIDRLNQTFTVEFHAGNYPVLDMQQLATRARPARSESSPSHTMLSYADLGFQVLAEVASLYLDRGEKPQALVAAGSVALGREPCKSYPGWGVVAPWPADAASGQHYDPESDEKTGWIVGKISQEHGMLTWEGAKNGMRDLQIGQKLMIWPNHACIAAINFGWFLVLDSDDKEPDVVRDVWLRCRGW